MYFLARLAVHYLTISRRDQRAEQAGNDVLQRFSTEVDLALISHLRVFVVYSKHPSIRTIFLGYGHGG